MEKLSNKELMKMVNILGAKQVIYLYIDSKINLTKKQLDMVIAIKNADNEE